MKQSTGEESASGRGLWRSSGGSLWDLRWMSQVVCAWGETPWGREKNYQNVVSHRFLGLTLGYKYSSSWTPLWPNDQKSVLPEQGTWVQYLVRELRSHMLQLSIYMPQPRLKISYATTKTQHSQTSKWRFFKKYIHLHTSQQGNPCLPQTLKRHIISSYPTKF